MNFILSVDLSELIFTYNCMFRLNIVCLITGMTCYSCILLFHIISLGMSYIGSITFFRSSVAYYFQTDIVFRSFPFSFLDALRKFCFDFIFFMILLFVVTIV